ncbi:hypothetical protein EC973_000440 [Apophysomyces ossiformis]|uniref:Uncharacterized protein n=1 Tax=Apophysomyces ossiformis TaxID=679940 RepID=A0A8H7BNF9_9FUNG|nr:hypothetical protein EC973_000440 [Apophysomyces ossiformis]
MSHASLSSPWPHVLTQFAGAENGQLDEMDDIEEEYEEGIVEEEEQEEFDGMEPNDQFIFRRDGNLVVVERRQIVEDNDRHIPIPDERTQDSATIITHNNPNREWVGDHLIFQPAPSPLNRRRRYTSSTTSSASDLRRTACTLRELVCDILKDAKALGATDLSWFQDT